MFSARQTLPGWLFAFEEEKRQGKHGQKSLQIGFRRQGTQAGPFTPHKVAELSVTMMSPLGRGRGSAQALPLQPQLLLFQVPGNAPTSL